MKRQTEKRLWTIGMILIAFPITLVGIALYAMIIAVLAMAAL